MSLLPANMHSRLAVPAAVLVSSALVLPGNVLPILAGLFADNYHIDEQRIGYLVSANTTMALAKMASSIAPDPPAQGDRRCQALGRVKVWIPCADKVSPKPDSPTPDQGSRGLTRSQQFQ